MAVPSWAGPTGNGDRLDDAEQNSQVLLDRAFRVASMVMSNNKRCIHLAGTMRLGKVVHYV
jgi:hypothetical protein